MGHAEKTHVKKEYDIDWEMRPYMVAGVWIGKYWLVFFFQLYRDTKKKSRWIEREIERDEELIKQRTRRNSFHTRTKKEQYIRTKK